MEQIYFALVDTPGFFASIIRRVTGINYIHVVLSMDEELQKTSSLGGRNPRNCKKRTVWGDAIQRFLYWQDLRRKIPRRLSGSFLQHDIKL